MKTKFRTGKKSFVSLFLFFLLTSSVLFSSRNASRYFPFIERAEEYASKGKSFFYPALFITGASTAFKSGGGNTGIPELHGLYDLKDVIDGLTVVKTAGGVSGYNPFANEIGYTDWNEKEIAFDMDGKVKSRGLILSGEQNLFGSDFSLGFFLPIMKVNTSQRFTFNSDNSHADTRSATTQEKEMMHRVRRVVHSDLGLQGSDWSATGVGDLDLYAEWRCLWDHKFKMRSIDASIRLGVLAPIGTLSHQDYPSSVSFMGDGHWAVYCDKTLELELKQNWRLGLITGFVYQFKDTRDRRISYYKESPLFSALKGSVEVDPGSTIKISPYFTLENLMDGLNFQIRYTYLHHFSDDWVDKRTDKTVKSYLELDKPDIGDTRVTRRRLSKWTSNYVTMQVMYDSVEGMKNWAGKPKLYAILDYAFSGNGVAKSHQFTLGVEFSLW